MSQETLNRLRVLVPGVLLLLVLPPLFLKTLDLASLLDRFKSIQILGDSVAVVVLGALYRILDLRRFAWRKSLRRVNNNIKDKLLDPCLKDSLISAAAGKLREGRALMHVFYKFIDRDPTLQEQGKKSSVQWTVLE